MIGAEEETKSIGALSCEYGTGDYWPYVVVTYSRFLSVNNNGKNVDKGSTLQMVASYNDGTVPIVQWSSSDEGVATISSSGIVTGISAGCVTITATDSEGNTKASTVYVTIPDGVYYIKNASSGYCLQASGSIASIYPQETDQEERVEQLWKIEYVSSGQYRIYSMQDLDVAMVANNSTKYVTLGSVPAVGNWGIVEDALGYAIQYGDSSRENVKPVVSGVSGSMVCIGALESNLACRWELESASGIFLRDSKTREVVTPSTEAILAPGRTCFLADLGIDCEYYGAMTGDLIWSADEHSIVRVNMSGQLTGVSSGVAEIMVFATINGVFYSYSCNVRVQSTVLVLSNSPEDWIDSSQTMGEDLASAVGAESSRVQAVTTENFADIWNNTTADHIIIHTHGSPDGLFGEALAFITQNIPQLQRNSAIRFVLITACETGGDNNGYANIASMLSQCIAQEGVLVCSTTIVEGGATEFTALDDDNGNPGEWHAYCNGEQIQCNLPVTITMALVADFWEEFR